MNIKLKKLVVKGQNKATKEIDFRLENTLIQGASDTGKSYILSCIYYCLGGKTPPDNIGHSQGYTTFFLSFSLNDTIYTIIRDYAFTINYICASEIYETEPPKDKIISLGFNDFFITELRLNNYKILVKSGKLGNITLSNLKYFSFFDEDRTLAKDSFISKKERSNVTERLSLFSFLISKQDDSNLKLSTSTDDKLRIEGKISVYNNEITSLNEWYNLNNFDKNLSIKDINEKIFVLDVLIEAKMDLKIINQNQINELNSQLVQFRDEQNLVFLQNKELNENLHNFETLNSKYESDKARLVSIINTDQIFNNFENHNCPLCDSIILTDKLNSNIELNESISYEINKINLRQKELNNLIPEIKNEILINELRNLSIENNIKNNLSKQLNIKESTDLLDLKELTYQKNIFENSLLISEKIEKINELISVLEAQRLKKIKVNRSLAEHFDEITKICKSLLFSWGISEINNIYISEKEIDLIINQRSRISFGKGKRAIFLTAFAISLMQYSLSKGFGHLGFIIIDSPLVTHKDKKHGILTIKDENEKTFEINDYTSQIVTQKFYKWLSKYNGAGQIIIIENDQPDEKYMEDFNYIEFTGNDDFGRRGFY